MAEPGMTLGHRLGSRPWPRSANRSAQRLAEALSVPRSRTARWRRPRSRSLRPQLAEHGDFATNLALKLAKPLRQRAAPDRRSARRCTRCESATMTLAGARRGCRARLHQRLAGPRPMSSESLDDIRANAGFVRRHSDGQDPSASTWSSCPPIRPARSRSAMRAAPSSATSCAASWRPSGHDITREYYFNDSGTQVELLGASVRAAALGEPVPEDGYHGEYVEIWRATVPDDVVGPGAGRRRHEPTWILGDWASERDPRGHRGQPGAPRRPLRRLEERELPPSTKAGSSAPSSSCKAAGHVYEQDGAMWFRSTAFGDDKDRVDLPLQRRADLLRRRHRLRRREVRAAASTSSSTSGAPTITARSRG